MDEVTQYEHIGTGRAISERFLVPVREALIEAYPFEIAGFYADNASSPFRTRSGRRALHEVVMSLAVRDDSGGIPPMPIRDDSEPGDGCVSRVIVRP